MESSDARPGTHPVLDPARAALLDDVLRTGGVRSVYQPIVHLDSGEVVAHEALARGPVGPLESPDQLFATAGAVGRLSELDAACRVAAVVGAGQARLFDPLAVFVNIEPGVLETANLDDLVAAASAAAGPLRIVLEITERALAARPAQLLAAVARVRSLGWAIALDDVGADSMSLAFMPLLRPDVIKLDLRLVQQRPDADVAEIMSAVAAHAERTGALVLAEGIETAEHLAVARALGASLGQGWMLGRPTPTPDAAPPARPLLLPPAPAATSTSPFACLPPTTPTRTSRKGLLIEISKHLERQALTIGENALVVSTFQEARHFTPSTIRRYTALAAGTGFVAALGEGMTAVPLPGVRGGQLAPGDVVRGEWDIAVIGPHFAAALLARDLGDSGPDVDRRFTYALTHDRDAVAAAAAALLARVADASPLAVAGALAGEQPEATAGEALSERGTPAARR